jgi:hypothetical protein
MTGMLLAEFSGGEALFKAAQAARTEGYRALDAFSPFPVEGLVDELEPQASHVRVAMFVGGVGIAALAYALEWYGAVLDYPINSGGRPLHSWPAFLLFPFAIGILAAAISGLIALFVQTGLPRLHHTLFDIDGFERVSQDAFLLALAAPPTDSGLADARERLRAAGAVKVWEVTT